MYECYHISLIIRQSFSLPKNPKVLDPSYKMDLDLWECLGKGSNLYYQIVTKFHRTDLVIFSHSREGNTCLIAQ